MYKVLIAYAILFDRQSRLRVRPFLLQATIQDTSLFDTNARAVPIDP
jgi:hypothetical protein